MIVYTLSENNGQVVTVYESVEELMSDVIEDIRKDDREHFTNDIASLSADITEPGASVTAWSTLYKQFVFIQKHEIKTNV